MRILLCSKCIECLRCHDLAKWLSHYLYFFSFLFLLSWTYYTEGSVGKCHITSVTVTWQEVTASHYMISHNGSYDRYGKVVHRPCSSCISSVENLMGTLLSSLCQMLIKSSWLNSGLELALWYEDSKRQWTHRTDRTL